MALIDTITITNPNDHIYLAEYPLVENEFYEKLSSINRKLELLEKINRKKNWIRRRKR